MTTNFSYTIAPEIFQDHPEYRRGVVVFAGLDNSRPDAGLTALLRESEAALRERIAGNPAEYPQIAAWREAYRRFGAKPSEHRSAIEALSRRVLKPDTLPDINPLVDIGNLLSLRYVLPAGVHPIGAHSQEIALRKTEDGDGFLVEPGKAPESIAAGEIVLAAGQRVLTRRWTWRQAADTRTVADTSCVFFDIDGLPPSSRDDVENAVADVVALVGRYCGGRCLGQAVLDATQPVMRIALD